MESAITLIIFTVPGLLTYFWINLFGITPAIKKNNSEMAAISILLWVPILGIVFTIYNLLALLSRYKLLQPEKSVPILKKDWRYIDSLSDLVELSGSIWFLFFYILLTVITSYSLAKFASMTLYNKFLKHINNVRSKNDIAPYDKHTTVWDSVFLNNDGQIVEYKKYGESESIKGCLVKVPREHEPGKSIVLEAVDHWTNVIEYYTVQIDYTYVDIENGIVINIYNLEKALEAETLFNIRFPNGITS
ncbi:MAG: hypothetical protein ABS949_10955 [Solibacillus sp.]